jgi:hypothetical protein
MAFTPDGRLLVAAGADGLYAWEALTGRRVWHLAATKWSVGSNPAGFATCLAMTPDGSAVATGHSEGIVWLWDLGPARKALTVTDGPANAETCWADLAAESPRVAYAAIERLAASPELALPMLRHRLAPVKIESQWLAARVAELDSAEFAVRQVAQQALISVADAVQVELAKELARTDSVEVRSWLRRVLETERPAVPPAESVRALRAVAVLERIGTEESRRVLERIAKGEEGARLTRVVREALERMERPAIVRP